MNFDATISEEKACLAVVGRNHKKRGYLSLERKDQDTLKVKAKAPWLVGAKAKDLGYKNVICKEIFLHYVALNWEIKHIIKKDFEFFHGLPCNSDI